MRQKGFTLLELLVVISIVAILGTSGFAIYNNYSRSQVIQTSAADVQTMLNLARSRAQSQVKPSICTEDLDGYRVKIDSTSGNYSLNVVCTGISDPVTDDTEDELITKQNKTLPSILSFGADTSFFFPVMTGGVSSSGCIEITDGSLTRGVSIDSMGEATVQESCP